MRWDYRNYPMTTTRNKIIKNGQLSGEPSSISILYFCILSNTNLYLALPFQEATCPTRIRATCTQDLQALQFTR